ncbi:hypothetical protein ACET3Z_007441 [Daucus carota]
MSVCFSMEYLTPKEKQNPKLAANRLGEKERKIYSFACPLSVFHPRRPILNQRFVILLMDNCRHVRGRFATWELFFEDILLQEMMVDVLSVAELEFLMHITARNVRSKRKIGMGVLRL